MQPTDVKCRMCGAKKGEPCVYIPVPYRDARTPEQLVRQLRTGIPTKRPHNARFQRMRWEVQRQQRQGELRIVETERDRALQANSRALHREYQQLRAWLSLNAHILFSEKSLGRVQ